MIYLDNAATTWPKPQSVYATWNESFQTMLSPKRGTAEASVTGAARLMQARETLANLFNVPNTQAHRVVFTSGATHALNMAIQAYPWQAGDAVLMSALEHHALSRPIRKMAREKGIVFYVVPYTDAEPFDLQAAETLLREHPEIQLIATTHASNVIGSVLPVAHIGALAHRYGKHYLVDAAQTAGVLPIDVQAMHIDMLAVPGHKCLYGPPGIGALYVADTVTLNPFIVGGTGSDSGKHEMTTVLPDALETGTIPLPQILTLAAGVDWVMQTGLQTIIEHERALLSQLLQGIQTIPNVHVYGHTDVLRKTPVVSFNVPGWSPKVLGNQLAAQFDIALRAGFHCAPMAHEAIGSAALGGTVRVSLGYFTTPQDVDAFLSALQHLLLHQPVA